MPTLSSLYLGAFSTPPSFDFCFIKDKGAGPLANLFCIKFSYFTTYIEGVLKGWGWVSGILLYFWDCSLFTVTENCLFFSSICA